MEMEKAGKKRKRRERQKTKSARREGSESWCPVLPSSEEVLPETFMLVQLQRRRRLSNHKEEYHFLEIMRHPRERHEKEKKKIISFSP